MLNIVFNAVKYLLEGVAVAIAVAIISKGKMQAKETAILALTVSMVFIILDLWAPMTGQAARHGSGFGMGYNLVGGGDDVHGSDSNNERANEDINTKSYVVFPSDYGHTVRAGFNEDAQAYNGDKLNVLAEL